MNVEKRQEIERKVVRHLIREMKKVGWIADKVDDGDDEYIKVSTEAEVMESVFAVDEAQIRFKKGGAAHWVTIILGNDGWDCISDYSYSDSDDFEKVMKERVDPYTEKLELECS